MKDSILKGTGNSRFLRTALPAGTTWAEALTALRNGNFPIDLAGANEDGFEQMGTPLNKANMLTDELAQSVGLDDDATLLTFLTTLTNLLTLSDESTGEKYLMKLSVDADGFPALAISEVSV